MRSPLCLLFIQLVPHLLSLTHRLLFCYSVLDFFLSPNLRLWILFFSHMGLSFFFFFLIHLCLWFIERSWENLKTIRTSKDDLIKTSPSFKKKSSSKFYSQEEHIFRFFVVTLMSDLSLTLRLWETGISPEIKIWSTIFRPCQVPNSWPWFILLKLNACLLSFTPLSRASLRPSGAPSFLLPTSPFSSWKQKLPLNPSAQQSRPGIICHALCSLFSVYLLFNADGLGVRPDMGPAL